MILQKKRQKELEEYKLTDKSLRDQFEILRKYIIEKYKLDYMCTFIFNEKYLYFDGISDIGTEFINNLNLTNAEIRVNRDVLQDSKWRNIKARFLIPITISGHKFIILIEHEKVNGFQGNEKNIYKDIYKFKDLIET